MKGTTIAAIMPGTTSSRPSNRWTSALIEVHAHVQSLPSSLRSKRLWGRKRLGRVNEKCAVLVAICSAT